MLSQTDIERYRADGHVVPDYRVPEEVLGEIRAGHDRLIAKHPEFEDYCPALLAFDTWFLNVARIPEIVDMVGQLIGPDIALWNLVRDARIVHPVTDLTTGASASCCASAEPTCGSAMKSASPSGVPSFTPAQAHLAPRRSCR